MEQLRLRHRKRACIYAMFRAWQALGEHVSSIVMGLPFLLKTEPNWQTPFWFRLSLLLEWDSGMCGADAGPLVAHSQARMLQPAALLDFEAHLAGLLACGEREQAVKLWKAVLVVVHFPPTEASEFRIHKLGSLREVPCVVAGRARCTEQRGGFQFPWLGTWTKRAVLVQAEVGADAWDLYYAGRDYLEEDQLRALDSGMRVPRLVPDHMARFISFGRPRELWPR